MQNMTRRKPDQETDLRKKTSMLTTIPFGILAVTYLLFLQRDSLPPSLLSSFSSTSYVLSFVGLALSYGFNRGRIFLLLVLLIASQFVLTSPAFSAYDTAGAIYASVCLFLPFNILISLFKEQGLFTPWGKNHAGIVLLQVAFITWLAATGDAEILAFIRNELFPADVAYYTPVPHTALLAFCAVLLILIIRRLIRKSLFDNTCLAILLALFMALHFKVNPIAIPLFYASAAGMLIVAAIHESYSIAFLDELTELPSRRALREDLMKLGDTYTIAMLDIDHFKKFNDTYGHDTGDDVLRLIASVMQNVTGGGKAFRYGGEEFTVLFPGKSLDTVLPHLEDLRGKIANRTFSRRGKNTSPKRLSVTISIGVAEKNKKYVTADKVIKAADEALYRAKENGRNCVST
jgi:diguanylate cyclase (GGDEF)-like protein